MQKFYVKFTYENLIYAGESFLPSEIYVEVESSNIYEAEAYVNSRVPSFCSITTIKDDAEGLKKKSFDEIESIVNRNSRYPYTYADDYIRGNVIYSCSNGGPISRSCASQIIDAVAKGLGMPSRKMAEKLSKEFVVKSRRRLKNEEV